VSQCATTRLIKQLDLARTGEAVSDTGFKQYAALFMCPLVLKAIAALRAATRLADDDVSNVATALAMEEVGSKGGGRLDGAVEGLCGGLISVDVIFFNVAVWGRVDGDRGVCFGSIGGIPPPGYMLRRRVS
jgi:hypothetical protein